MSQPASQIEPERFPASSPRWERARLATAYDEAAECLWAEITEACQRSLTRAGRIEAALGAVLALFEREPELANLVVLTAPLSAEAGLADKHQLLADHLVELLAASLPGGARGREGEAAARGAIEKAFALTAAYLSGDGVRGIERLRAPLTKALLAARHREPSWG